MKKPLYVYLAGKITGASDADIFDWRDVAARDFLAMGVGVCDPARGSMAPASGRQYEEKNHDYKHIVEKDLDMVRKCGAVLANVTAPSWGTAMEIYFASEVAGIPVALYRRPPRPDTREVREPWSAFLLYYSGAQFDNLGLACSWCARHLGVTK